MHKLLIKFKRSSLLVLTALLMTGQFLFLSQAAAQQRIKEIAAVAGERSNQLIGYGLVVGLDGSGDHNAESLYAAEHTGDVAIPRCSHTTRSLSSDTKYCRGHGDLGVACASAPGSEDRPYNFINW